MSTVFLSGSRTTYRLNDGIKFRIRQLLDKETDFIVGDANGADTAMQGFLAAQNYKAVKVYCSGSVCRNNVGSWNVQSVYVDPTIKGRAFYTQKDKKMASIADSGFVLWDGKSIGSINNVYELLKKGKDTVVYLSPKNQFIEVTNPCELKELIQMIDKSDARTIHEKLKITNSIDQSSTLVQGVLNLT